MVQLYHFSFDYNSICKKCILFVELILFHLEVGHPVTQRPILQSFIKINLDHMTNFLVRKCCFCAYATVYFKTFGTYYSTSYLNHFNLDNMYHTRASVKESKGYPPPEKFWIAAPPPQEGDSLAKYSPPFRKI